MWTCVPPSLQGIGALLIAHVQPMLASGHVEAGVFVATRMTLVPCWTVRLPVTLFPLRVAPVNTQAAQLIEAYSGGRNIALDGRSKSARASGPPPVSANLTANALVAIMAQTACRTGVGTFYFFAAFRGRPRGRNVDSNPNWRAARLAQVSLPKGAPR